ncbi:MAG TPA: cytochrome c oxidase subunit II [Candidatus Tectomicrobia bacterium]|jgi:cytochrome c oxidase subunit 2
MWSNLPLFPEQASTIAGRVDGLFAFLVAVSAFFTALIFFLILYFAIKYRRRSEAEQSPPIYADPRLEVLWTIIPLGLTMVMFVWGASLYFTVSRPPAEALGITVVGKQWMWKFQHPEGPREINELHVPVGRPVQLTMASEDVIHSVYIPAFRMKMDVVPGRFTTAWFEATKTGTFHLFCAEYCGTAHAGMSGRVVVMTPTAYEQWLSGGATEEPPVVAGERLFQQLGCSTCHRADAVGRGPALDGLFGQTQQLQSGGSVVVDEAYLRESILEPNTKIVAGYPPIMPTFQGQVSEEGLLHLIAYIRSLSGARR